MKWKLSLAVAVFSMGISACTSPGNYFDRKEPYVLKENGKIELSKEPYNCYFGPNHVAVGAELPRGSQGTLRCRPQDKPAPIVETPMKNSWDRIHYAELLKLKPGASYSCEVEVMGKTTAPFTLRPTHPPNRPFKFIVMGDSRGGDYIMHNEIAKQMEKRDAQLYIHLGDMVNHGNLVEDWDLFFEVEEKLLQKFLFLPVPGNHDMSKENFYSELFFQKDRFGQPQRFQAVEYGNSLFFTLDTTRPIRVGDAQYRFLIEQIPRATSGRYENVFFFMHHPLYSSGEHGDNEILQKVLKPIFRRTNARVIFSGHDHHYERTKLIDGVQYMITGGGGSDLRPAPKDDHSESTKVTFHFLEVTVNGRDVKIQAIDYKGNVFDEVVLR